MGRDRPEPRWRMEFAITTAVIFAAGFLLFGVAAAFQERHHPGAVSWMGQGLMGGYLFFSMLSGLRLAVRWIGGLPLTAKVILTVFFPVPVYFVMFGVFYALPYGIYNMVRLIQMRREAPNHPEAPPEAPPAPMGREDPW